MHCVLAIGLSWAENHEGLNCTAGAFRAACSQGWAGGEGREGGWSWRWEETSAWAQCRSWINVFNVVEVHGLTVCSAARLESQLLLKRNCRFFGRGLLALSSSTTGFPTAPGAEHVKTPRAPCLPLWPRITSPHFLLDFLTVLAKALGPVSYERARSRAGEYNQLRD